MKIQVGDLVKLNPAADFRGIQRGWPDPPDIDTTHPYNSIADTRGNKEKIAWYVERLLGLVIKTDKYGCCIVKWFETDEELKRMIFRASCIATINSLTRFERNQLVKLS